MGKLTHYKIISSSETPPPGALNVMSYGAHANGSTDDLDHIQNAIDALGSSGGDVYLPPATYALSGALSLPHSNSATLTLWGYGATFKLTASNPQLFSCTTAGVTYKKLAFRGFMVDAQNTGTSGGGHICSITCPGSGTSIEDLLFKNLTVTNVPVYTQGHYWCIDVYATGTTHVWDVIIQGCTAYGGVGGFSVWAPTGSNVDMDRIYIRNCYHDTLNAAPTAFDVQENYHLGQAAHLGTCEVTDCVGKNSWDVGIEIDQPANGLIRDCTIYDVYDAAGYITNFATPKGGGGGYCKFERLNTILTASGNHRGFGIVLEESLGGNPLGSYDVVDCTFTVQNGAGTANTHSALDFWGANTTEGFNVDGYVITDPTGSSNSTLFNHSNLSGPHSFEEVYINGSPYSP